MCIVIVGDPNVSLLESKLLLDIGNMYWCNIKTTWSPGGVRGLLTMSYG